MLVAVVLVAGGCGGFDGQVTGRGVEAIVDVDDALTDRGPVRYRYTQDLEDFGIDESRRVVVEGERDVERSLSTEVRTTTISTEAVPGSVDDGPETFTARRESVTVRGTTWLRSLDGTSPGAWSPFDAGGEPWPGDGYGEGFATLVEVAERVDRYTFVSVERLSGRGVTRRLRGRSIDEYDEATNVDVWLDQDGQLARIATPDADVDLWPLGHDLVVEDPSPVASDDDAVYDVLAREEPYPDVPGPWEVEAEGATAGGAWKVVRAVGRVVDVEVPCRMLVTEAGGEGWDDIDLALEDEISVCGAAGGWGLASAVADPALQVLVPRAAWEAGPADEAPLGLAVSPRFAGSPVVLVGQDGSDREVTAGPSGLVVVDLPGTFLVTEVVLADGSVVCDLGVEDFDVDGSNAVGWLDGVTPVCTEA